MSQQKLWDLLQITILQSSPKKRMHYSLKTPAAFIITSIQPFQLVVLCLLSSKYFPEPNADISEQIFPFSLQIMN